MKINVNTGKRTPKMRILSAFMAVLIFSLTFTNLIGQLGIRVKADDTIGHIHNNTTNKVSQYKTNMNNNKGSTGSEYTYTGNYTNDNAITMFDYVSDIELNEEGINSYNNFWHEEAGYTDEYTKLNDKISSSAGYVESPPAENVTFMYDNSSYIFGEKGCEVYLFNSSKQLIKKYVTQIISAGKYKVTLKYDDIPNVSSCKYIKFKDVSGKWYTYACDISSITKGKAYKVTRSGWNTESGWEPYNGGATVSLDSNDSAEEINGYSIPLYFGNFWEDNDASGYTVKPGDVKSGTNQSTHGPYNNFYWQANMGLKPYDTNGSASTQKLVGNNLSGPDDEDAKGNLLDVNHCTYNENPASNDEVELPYFSKTWADNNKTSDNKPLIRYYDEDVVGGNITFPFYEVYKEHNSTGRYERYYQFDSREANLKFNIQDTNDINNHKGYFSESGTDIVRYYYKNDIAFKETESDRSNVGFFPFNATNDIPESVNWNNHNLGFGMKMEMDFQLEADGRVKVMNKDSNDKLTDIEGDGVERVPTIFEFTGDDDLWVFIDGNLVLDMGGDHFKSHGKIDFYNQTATVDSAIDFNAGSGYDDLGATPSSYVDVNSSSSPTFLSLLSGHNFDSTNPGKYDTTTTHTLTVFYMERGMLDSNLLIRFNYSPIPNNSRMKIAEVTKFDDVNEGLKPATKRAAEGDVFKYTVTNTLPSNILPAEIETPLSSGAKYPELGAYTRTAEGNSSWTTTLTPNGTGTAEDKLFVNGNAGVETYVKDTAYWWVDGFSNGSWLVGKTTPQSGSDNGGDFWLMYGTADILYGDSKRGVESSAEFEKQFTRNSTMKVVQGTNLYRLPDRDANGHTTLFNDSGQLQAVEQTGTGSTQSRTVSNYYSTNYRLIDRNNNDLTTINDLNNTKTFSFNNDASVGDSFAVMLTEFVENTVKVGAITIKKQKPTEDTIIPSDKEFAVKVRFEDVFGIEGVNADSAAEYRSIKYSVYDSSGVVTEKTNLNMAAGKVTVGGVQKDCGIISLKVGEWAAISGIPVGTKYIIYEEEPKYAPTYVNNNSNVSVGTINTTGDSPDYLSNVSNNNATVTNFSHSLTIKEVTDFSTVNSGLLTYTKKAAENDVFKYTVKNDSNVDAINSGIATPTYDTYTRTANNNSTVLSGQPVQYVMESDSENVYFNVSQLLWDGETSSYSKHWDDDAAVIVAWLWNDGSEGSAKEFEKVSEYLYRIYPENKNNMIILRLNPNIKTQHPDDWLFYVWKNQTDKDKPYVWNRIGGDSGIPAANGTYKVTNWTTVNYTSGPVQIPTSEVIYNYNNYIYDSSDSDHYVKNVNYEWVDEFASKTSGTANDLLAGTTDNTGSFYLMHGTTAYAKNSVTYTQDKESSATFYNQFARDSTMTVVQSDTLTSPNGGTPDTLKANNKRGASTSLGNYYTTTKTLEGSTTSSSLTNNVLPDDNNSFTFDNNNANQSIHITETFTNTVKNGAISVHKQIANSETTNETFTFQIKLEDVFGVDSADVDSTGYGGITISGTNSTNLTDTGQFTISSTGTAMITGIPVGTKYTITEISAQASEFEFDSSGSLNYSGTVKAYSDESNQTPDNNNKAVIQNKRKSTSSTEIILKKTAKEQVGNINIGDTLAGAKFKLVNVNAPTTDIKLKKTDTDPAGAISGKKTKEYSVSDTGTFNITSTSNWIETGEDGRLHIKGLAPGDYYLEEQTAPSGYSNLDSNRLDDSGNAQPKRVYFSVGDNTKIKNITCSDEMDAAYIKLYEHINEKRDAWGNPTFIFRITQTKDASGVDLATQRTHIVALTVNDDDTLDDNVLSGSTTGKTFTSWKVESTDEIDDGKREYQGMYHIDSQGRIRVEPGEYTITRIPVSRYEFVTAAKTDAYTGTTAGTQEENIDGSNQPLETVTITDLTAGKTIDVHYYDEVKYYDKFSHVDEQINPFYQLDTNNKNTTVKGISVSNILSNAVTISESTGTVNVSAYKVFVDGTVDTTPISGSKLTIEFDSSISGDFSYSNGTITIQNATTTHHQKVYTVTAKYDNNKFTTTFDIAIQ